MKKFIVPLVAGAVAATLMTAPAVAGGAGNDRSDRVGASQVWEQQEFKSRKAKRKAARAENRKANRRGKYKQHRQSRKARRNAATGAGAYAGSGYTGGKQGSITELLTQGGPLPEYLGGYNQPLGNGSGSITQSLNGYDLPDYIGGYNQAPSNGSGSILDAIGDVNIYQ
ncbi:MAG: hypothetical protein AB8B82_16750 [Roseovarius sp.]